MLRQRRRSSGFTLLELLIVVIAVGIMSLVISPILGKLTQARQEAKRQEARAINLQIADAMIAASRHSSTDGSLPAPYTGSGFFSAVANPSATATFNAAVISEIRGRNVGDGYINSDGSAAANVRVYQRVADLTASIPYFGLSGGTSVVLKYDFGVVYQSVCAKADSTCNKSPLAGGSPTLTSSNYKTWDVAGSDIEPVYFSTLPVQQDLLEESRSRTGRLRDSFVVYFNERKLAAAAGDQTNFYPAPTGVGAPDNSGATPTTNQDCHDGWYPLDATTNLNVLDQIGLSKSEFGSTPWGGRFEYCRDYEPGATGTSTANTVPHYAAIRFNKNLTDASNPSAGTATNNVFVTF